MVSGLDAPCIQATGGGFAPGSIRASFFVIAPREASAYCSGELVAIIGIPLAEIGSTRNGSAGNGSAGNGSAGKNPVAMARISLPRRRFVIRAAPLSIEHSMP
ncbi:MAG: hypothetical protein HOJ95_09140 [Nitrospinaceae bacterium]|nr:hypothetical protein [Nitrospinaceae bacterium]MBT3432446.1 hypothetical protein [Nitrospinaceae bacterium]MBT3823112.1 hypothetical protein [Nitrospinaceae bacterium]MBT5947115.1 hypothetical protein [Nitrospinaceae bacterium]MBT6394857.1 hypothetical protein [Nitrospinaceae bacterium]